MQTAKLLGSDHDIWHKNPCEILTLAIGKTHTLWRSCQPYLGLHQEKHGQQVGGGDPAPLLCSGETSPGVLRPALEPPAQEGHGAIGAGPEEGHKNDPRAGTPFLGGQAERLEAVQPGEEKAVGTPDCGLSVL